MDINKHISSSRLEIEEFVASVDDRTSKNTIIRDIDILLKSHYIKKTGSARSIKYLPANNNELLIKYDVENYFKGDFDNTVRMEPKKGSDLKSSQFLNALRVIPASVGILTFSIVSVAVVAIESVSVVGLVVVPRTCKGFGILISSMAKGLNYKLKAGHTIQFKLDTPVYIKSSDILSK